MARTPVRVVLAGLSGVALTLGLSALPAAAQIDPFLGVAQDAGSTDEPADRATGPATGQPEEAPTAPASGGPEELPTAPATGWPEELPTAPATGQPGEVPTVPATGVPTDTPSDVAPTTPENPGPPVGLPTDPELNPNWWRCEFDAAGVLVSDTSGAMNLCLYVSWEPGPAVVFHGEVADLACSVVTRGNGSLATKCAYPAPVPDPDPTSVPDPDPTTVPDADPTTVPDPDPSTSVPAPTTPPAPDPDPSTPAPDRSTPRGPGPAPATPAPPVTGPGEPPAPEANVAGSPGTPPTEPAPTAPPSAPQATNRAPSGEDEFTPVPVDPADQTSGTASGIGAPPATVDVAVSVAVAIGGVAVLGGLWFAFRGLLGRF